DAGPFPASQLVQNLLRSLAASFRCALRKSWRKTLDLHAVAKEVRTETVRTTACRFVRYIALIRRRIINQLTGHPIAFWLNISLWLIPSPNRAFTGYKNPLPSCPEF